MKRLWQLLEEAYTGKLSSGRYQQLFVTHAVFLVWGAAAIIRQWKSPASDLLDIPIGIAGLVSVYLGIGAYKRSIEGKAQTSVTSEVVTESTTTTVEKEKPV